MFGCLEFLFRQNMRDKLLRIGFVLKETKEGFVKKAILLNLHTNKTFCVHASGIFKRIS